MSTPLSDDSDPPLAQQRLPYPFWLPAVVGGVVGLVMRLLFRNNDVFGPFRPMTPSFLIFVPMLVGAVTVYVAERSARRSWRYYILMPALANLLFVVGTLAVLIEGVICAILIVPMFAGFGALGGLAMGAVCRLTMRARPALYCFAAVPFLLGAFAPDEPLPARWRLAESVRPVNAAPAEVWRALTATGAIAANEVDSAWMYRIGVPPPESGIVERRGDEIVRHVTMGHGIHFDQVATKWEPGRRVRWAYRFAADSFPEGALDDHVRIGGRHFDLGETEYRLVPRGEATELHIVMRYRVSTEFNWYAGPLADWLIGDFERTILGFYARRAENAQVRLAANAAS